MHSRSSKHILLLVLLLVACVAVAGGQTTQTSTDPLTITEPVADDLLAAARELHVQAEVKGDVAAVKAAIEAGTSKVQGLGKLIASHVIPRPSAAVLALLPK